MDCIGALYCGYTTYDEAVNAYRDGVNAGLTEALPIIIMY